MRIVTSFSARPDPADAVDAAYREVTDRLGRVPDLLILYCAATYDAEGLMRGLRHAAPNVRLLGATSCLGAMTEHSLPEATGIGLLALSDPGGAFGVGAAAAGDPRTAAALAARRALENASRPGEVPDLLWITQAPGQEELILQGLEDVVGPNVPIAGGSSADNTLSGEWKQFANGEVYQDGVVVAALFPSTGVAFAFHSGYEPTASRGRVTRATGRTIWEIDGLPAAGVYDSWAGGLLSDLLAAGGRALERTSLHPLGRVEGSLGGVPYFRLSHPEAVIPGGGLALFSEIRTGEEVFLMRGTEESLVRRAGRVAHAAMETEGISRQDVAGALVVYCAGCMLAVRPRISDVAAGLRVELGGTPFLGTFTFGEQGRLPGGQNKHGNLMISVLVFKK